MSRALDYPLLIVGALGFAFALPSDIFPQGLGLLGWFCLVPTFVFTRRRSWLVSALGGALFGTCLLLGSAFWLTGFHPLAFLIVLLVVVPQYVAVFVASHFFWRWLPHQAVWAQAALWVVFEWSRTLGWLAFPYASLVSTQAFFPVTFQTASLVGTHGLTFLLALVSAFAASGLDGRWPWRQAPLAVGLLTVNLAFGVVALSQAPTGEPWRVALVQNVQDPWKSGVKAYSGALDNLVDLSRLALAQNPDAVFWPETSFVPGIDWHTRYRPDPDSWLLVKRLQSFLASTSTPFLLGTDHGVLADDGTTRLDYNAAVVWDNGWQGRYLKNRLVPFTEFFPWRRELPGIAAYLESHGSHFWEAGSEAPVLPLGGVNVGTLICFEDEFAAQALPYSRRGARVLVNLTNDSWTGGTAARDQHLALAVFRAVETGMPLLRAANDGRTALVAANGVVTRQLDVGSRGVLVGNVTLGNGRPTFYAATGDWAPILALLGLATACLWALTRQRRSPVDPN